MLTAVGQGWHWMRREMERRRVQVYGASVVRTEKGRRPCVSLDLRRC